MSDGVKLRGSSLRRGLGRSRKPALLVVALLLVLPWGRPAAAQLLDFIGSMPKPVTAPLDPRLPTGARLGISAPRPVTGERPACSFVRPVCVQTDPDTPAELALGVLRALEDAYERLTIGLGLPAPLPDRGAGGSDALDLYLVADDSRKAASLDVASDAPFVAEFDRAPGYCVLSNAARASAEELRRFTSLCLAESILLRLDPAETPHLRRAVATELWWITGTPTDSDYRDADDAQARPERAIGRRDLDPTSGGSALFFEYLEREHGIAGPGALSAALVASSAGKTAGNALLWNNEPDLFDVLRHTLHEDRPSVAALFSDFAVDRAFVGSRDDGQHLPGLAWLGDFGRVRFDWVMKYSSLPRRVAATRPIEPSGSIYIWLELDDLPLGAVLGFQANWEAPVPFKWSLVRVDKDGVELSRIDVPFQERGSTIEARITNLEAAAYVLVVGTNLGGADLAHPFDPDLSPFEAQSCTVYLAKL